MPEYMVQFHIVRIINSEMGGFPSGQRGQTVNLLQIASVVRIHLRPFARNEMIFTHQAGMVE